jgi:heavy metal translocating P-type ATPase
MNPRTTCDLCGAAATKKPQRQSFRDQEQQFCCKGCLNVYAILLESGAIDAGVDLRETELYQESQRLGLLSRTDENAVFLIPEGTETKEVLYQLTGMWCAACGWVVEHGLRKEYGIVAAEVLFTSDLLKVTYCPQLVPPGTISGRVKSLGYQAVEFGTEQDGERREWQDMLLRLGIAFGMWMNVMLFSLVIYASYWEGIAGWAQRAVPFILMALALPAVLYSAWPIHRIAWYGIKTGHLRMEALISTGILAAFTYSSTQAFLGGRHFYFDTACAIVTLVLAGKALERNAKDRSARAIAMLHRLLPKKARLRVDGEERFVAIEALDAGTVFLVKPGERIPADGVVVVGHSAVDESVVTGEADPRAKGPGDPVICGSLNTAGVLEIRVTRCGEDSTLAQIVKSVQTALASKSPLERLVDRVSRIFIPVVLVLSALTIVVCLGRGLSGTEAMLRGIAVLVIACPCALGIATPLATTAAIGAASRQGIIIRDVRVLETFRKVDLLILDKTGTVTEGDFRLRHAELEGLELVAALESYSEHPLAHAVKRFTADQGLGPLDASGIEVRAGRGLLGMVEGKRVVVGNRRLMAEEGVELPHGTDLKAHNWESEGLTVAFAALDGVCAGALAFGDRPRAEAAAVIAELRARGVRTVLLSGDAWGTTERIAKVVGVDDFVGEVSPTEKADTVRRFQSQGKVVAMVGDGINDAPALAAADLGIAMGSGADLAMHSAPVVLMKDSLTRITGVFRLATLTLRVLKQNLFWAFFYNTAGISLAMTGVLNPILAAGAMVLSSLSVIGNSMRLGRDRA